MKTITILFITLGLFPSLLNFGQSIDSIPTSSLVDTTKSVSYKLKYPAEARRKGIQGTVKIKMTFDSKCNVIKKEVAKSLGHGCDEEALLALTNMEDRIVKAKGNNCKDGEELIYPINFKIN